MTPVVGLALAETLLRLIWGFGNPLLLQKDSEIGYLYRPNQKVERFRNEVSINSFHQRGSELSVTPAPGVRRILFVGDSVTFGTTLLDQHQIISEFVADTLGSSSEARVEVMNASAGSWGLGNQLAYLRRFGTFGAQTVVLQIGSHDLIQKKSTSERVGVDPVMPDKRPLTALGELWIRYVQPRVTGKRVITARSTVSDEEAAAQFATNMSVLKEEIALVREADGHPIILHTPNRDEVVAIAGRRSPLYDHWRSRFLAIAENAGVPVINFTKLWAADAHAFGYFLDEVHLSAKGSAMVAGAFVSFISSDRTKATHNSGQATNARIARH